MSDELGRPFGAPRGSGRSFGARLRVSRRQLYALLTFAFACVLLGVFLGAEYPDAWYTRAVRAIASWL